MIKSPNKVVVITGAAGGLGSAITQILLSNDFHVVATDLTERLFELKKQPFGAHPKLSLIPMNVGDRTSVEEAAKQILTIHKRVDILVNNAGIFERTPLATLNEKALERIININLSGTLRCMSVFSKMMMHQREGRIINVASIAAERGAALGCVYSAAKAGIIAATYSAARELAESGISVNAIVPGYCDTPMLGEEKALVERFILPKIPKGRLGKPDEIGEVVLFLASCKAEYLTGSVIRIDGGLSVG